MVCRPWPSWPLLVVDSQATRKLSKGIRFRVLWVNQATHRECGDALTFRDVALVRRRGENPSWRKGWEMRHPLQLLLWWQNNDPHHHHPGYRSPNSSPTRSFSCPHTPQQQNIDCVWWGACFLLSGSLTEIPGLSQQQQPELELHLGIVTEWEREWRTDYLGNFILVGGWSLKR